MLLSSEPVCISTSFEQNYGDQGCVINTQDTPTSVPKENLLFLGFPGNQLSGFRTSLILAEMLRLVQKLQVKAGTGTEPVPCWWKRASNVNRFSHKVFGLVTP